MSNGFPIRTIKEAKRNRMGGLNNGDFVRRNIRRINETMSRTRINKGKKRREIGSKTRNNGKTETIGVRGGKSGSVEMTLLGHITVVNAISSVCGVLEIATYFFESLEPESLGTTAVAARALAAEEEDLGQSRAMCPAAPQNMQSLLSRRRLRSV